MSYLQMIFLVLWAQLHFTTAATCCMPKQFEAEQFLIEDNVRRIFVADFSRDRVFETTDQNSHVFTIYDLKNEKEYHFDDKGCVEKMSYKARLLADQCISEEDSEHQYINIGFTSLSAYSTQIGKVNMYRLVMGPGDSCLPLMTHVQEKTTIQTIVYSRWNKTISDTRIYSSFGGCQMDQSGPSDVNYD